MTHYLSDRIPIATLFIAAVTLTVAGCSGPQTDSPASPQAPTTKTVLTFLHFNDTYTYGPNAQGVGGFAALKTLLDRQIKAAPGPTVVTFGGDAISPTELAGVTKGAHMIEFLNSVGVSVAVPGNHEFDFGPPTLEALLRDSKFPWLAANVISTSNAVCCGMKDHVIIDMGGIKVGFFGLMTLDTEWAGRLQDNIVQPVAAVTAEQVKALRSAGAEVVVAVSHISFEEDRTLSETAGIDLVLGGHEHDGYAYFNSNKTTLALKVGWNSENLGVVELPVVRTDKGVVVKAPSWRVLSVQDIPEDPTVAALAKKNDELRDTLRAPIGTTDAPFSAVLALVKGVETPIGAAAADAMRQKTGADVALLHGFGFREMEKQAGQSISRLDLFEALPFNNDVELLDLSGVQLLDALEHAVSGFGDPNPRLLSRFVQVSGISFKVAPAGKARPAGCNPGSKGTRVSAVMVGGSPIKPTGTYRVAVADFMAEGGNGFCMLAGAQRNPFTGDHKLVSYLAEYITGIKTIVQPAPRITGLPR